MYLIAVTGTKQSFQKDDIGKKGTEIKNNTLK